jgi:hypothetical protein
MNCRSCGLNVLGHCSVYNSQIPHHALKAPNECDHWRPQKKGDAVAIAEGLADTHENHRVSWLTVADMMSGRPVPAGAVSIAWKLIWTAPYLDDSTRSLLASGMVPI